MNLKLLVSGKVYNREAAPQMTLAEFLQTVPVLQDQKKKSAVSPLSNNQIYH